VTIRSPLRVALGCAAFALLIGGLLWSRGSAGPVDELGRLALALVIVLTAALFGGHLAVRVGQPAVLGELTAGLLLGNLPGLAVLDFIGTDPYLNILSGIGMLLLMFEVGLDVSVRDLFAVGPSSLLVALAGSAASLVIGIGAAALLLPASPTATHVFLGAAITATSVGITARVLKDMGAQRSTEARVILGAAVVDDILALVLLGIVAASFSPGRGGADLGVTAITPLVMKTIGFLVLAILLGIGLMPAWFRQAARFQTKGALLAAGLGFCFLLSWAASSIGLAALVGAFAAGLVLEDTHSAIFVQRGERPLGELLQPMTGFLVPVFFVLVGFRADLGALAEPRLALVPLGLTVAAILGKLCCSAGVVHRGVSRLTVAAGMIPRGEVSLVFAALGTTLMVGQTPVLDQHGYASIVTVVVLTTLVTPPALKACLRRRAL
jgi:Kef-type K+ transport system membrane component KefB